MNGKRSAVAYRGDAVGVLGVSVLAPQAGGNVLAWVPGLPLGNGPRRSRLHCQFVTPPSNPARNGRGTSGGEKQEWSVDVTKLSRPHWPQVRATWSLPED